MYMHQLCRLMTKGGAWPIPESLPGLCGALRASPDEQMVSNTAAECTVALIESYGELGRL
jgi:hypothetical protein